MKFPRCLLGMILFASSLAQAEEPLDFSSAIQKIISRSTGVDVQQSTLESIQAKNLPLRLFFLPNLSFNGRTPIGGATNVFPLQKQLEITSQWNLFKWGADYLGMKSANYEEGSQKSTVDATLIEVEQDAVQALVLEIQKTKEVQISAEIVKTQSELSSIAQQRYQQGYLPIQEAEKITVDLANAKANWMDAKMNEATARAGLENLLGHSHVMMEWPWVAQFKKFRDLSILKEEQDVSHRPDWLAAQNKFQSLDYKVSQNWRLLLPTLDAQFSYGYYSGFFGSATGWIGYLSVSLPLFDHLNNYSSAKQQSYLRSVSETQLEQVRRSAKAEWTASKSTFQMALDSALSREETLKLSRKLYRDNQKRFEVGRISSNDLAVDRNRMFQAELNAIQGWSAVHLSYAKLCHSLGRRLEKCGF